jgi:hypothetical protein
LNEKKQRNHQNEEKREGIQRLIESYSSDIRPSFLFIDETRPTSPKIS